jgi:type II restriction enzyme
MNLDLDQRLSAAYKSPSQKARVLTENWVEREIYCPNCGLSLRQFPNSRPVADFFCLSCREEFELKSKKDKIGDKVVDGAYETMLERLKDLNNPNFFFLNYSITSWAVVNFLVIPKHFFTADIIEMRKPLSPEARRSHWVGCNILLRSIPEAGKIYFIRDHQVSPKDKVSAEWRRTLFLRESSRSESRGWTLTVMKCIDRLDKKDFLLDDVYKFEEELKRAYPGNKHIKDKIRQQLQILRDKGYLEFIGRGKYRLTPLEHKEENAR